MPAPWKESYDKAVLCLVTQSCPTLCNLMDWSPSGSSVHGILQARMLEWVAMPSSRGFSHPRDWTQVSCVAGRFFTFWATREAHDKARQHVKKQRHHFTSKGLYSQSYGFSSSFAWMWKLGLKKAEHQRVDTFELWTWRRLLRVPWTARRSKQSIL